MQADNPDCMFISVLSLTRITYWELEQFVWFGHWYTYLYIFSLYLNFVGEGYSNTCEPVINLNLGFQIYSVHMYSICCVHV